MIRIKWIILAMLLVTAASCATAPAEPEIGAEQVAEARSDALSAREQADSVRAAVGAKDEYQTGLQQMQEAETHAEASDYSRALNAYRDATAAFNNSYKLTNERREAAMLALEKAQRAIADAERTALDADRETADGGEQ